MTTKQKVEDAVFDAVERCIGCEATMFDTCDELGINSLDAVEITMNLERKFAHPFPDIPPLMGRGAQIYGIIQAICKHLGI